MIANDDLICTETNTNITTKKFKLLYLQTHIHMI